MKIGVLAESFSKSPVLVETLQKQLSGHTVFLGQSVPSDAEALIIGGQKVGPSFLQKYPQLKVLSKYGVGLDQIDFKACEAAGVRVVHEAGVNRYEVAEHTLGLMVGLTRNLFNAAREMREGTWNKWGGLDLRGATVGIVGFGHVGQALAELLRPFGCKIVFNDVADRKKEGQRLGATALSLDELLSIAAIVSLHVPLTAQTRKMIGPNQFLKMQKGSFLVNTARGEVVDFEALRVALDSSLGGAAFDVFAEEPFVDKGLLEHPRFFATPHTAGNSRGAVQAMGCAAINCLEKAIAGS